MRKILCLFLLIFAILICGCSNHLDSVVLNNMSDLRVNYFEGKNETAFITLSCGQRESNFAYDGISTSPLDCAVLTVEFFSPVNLSKIEATVFINGQEKNIVLNHSPFEDVFMEDLEISIENNSEVKIKLNNQENIELKNISSNWKINFKQAIKIATEHFNEKLKELYFNNRLNAECYLKVVAKANYEQKFWYFSIIDIGGKNYSLLIDVNSGGITYNAKTTQG